MSWNECNIMLLIIHWPLCIHYLYILCYLFTLTILTQPPEQNSEAAAGDVLKSFANFTGIHSCWSLFFTRLQAFRPAALLTRYTSVFLWNLRNSLYLFWRTSERLLLHHILIFIILLQYTFFISTNNFFFITQLKR